MRIGFALFAGEGHVPAEWSRAHRLDAMTRTLEFFARHLRAAKSATRWSCARAANAVPSTSSARDSRQEIRVLVMVRVGRVVGR